MPFTKKDKEKASRASLAGWRKKRGIKMKVSIKPLTLRTNKAVAIFEKKEYEGLGKTNSLALLDLFTKLKAVLEPKEEYPERG